MTTSALLLDSNVVVWLDEEPTRIQKDVVCHIEAATSVFVSAVTAWELSIKESLGDLMLARPVSEFVRINGLIELPISIHHGEAVRNLPPHHQDPFDRLLVAQAKVEGLTLVTADTRLSSYGIPVLQV